MILRLRSAVVKHFAATVGRIARRRGRLRILTFHDISDDNGDIYGVTKGRFAEYIDLLKDEGYSTVRASDIVANWPMLLMQERTVLITFDDAYAAQRDIASELLAYHGMTAIFFVISSLISEKRTRNSFGGKDRTFLSMADLQQLVHDGFEIGSHSHSHALLGTVSARQMDNEARMSKRILENAISGSVLAFAYPFGQRGAFSSMTRSILDRNGYSLAFTQEGIGIKSSCDLLRLSRISIDRSDTTQTFRRKLLGQYELLSELRSYE